MLPDTLKPTCRRITAILAFALLPACSTPPAPRPDMPAPPIIVGVSGDYPPFCEARSGPGTWQGYSGFDIELLRQLSADLGRPVSLRPYRWGELSKLMAEGRLDLAVCGITLRGDRASAMAFSRPYASSGAVTVIRAEDAAELPTLAALDRPGRRIAVNAGGHLERVARSRFRHAELRPLDDNRRLREALARGGVEAVVSDIHEAGRWSGVRQLGPFTSDLKALAMPLDRLPLRRDIDDWLARQEASGGLAALRQRQLLAGAAASPAGWCARALAVAIDLRLSLMPRVAAVKRRARLPISDPAQERQVLARVRADAGRAGLDEAAAGRLFQVLMAQARQIQARSPTAAAADVSLADLRRAVAAASDSLLPEIARCRSVLAGQEEAVRGSLDDRLSDRLDEGAIEALLAVLPPRADFSPSRVSEQR